MSDSVLTIDLGNTSCGARLWSRRSSAEPERLARGDLANDAELETRLRELLRDWTDRHGAPARAALSSVAAEDRTRSVVEVLRATGAAVQEAPDPGLVNVCKPPDRVGRDRLYAARGALALLGGPAVVVDAGTALTVDALLVAEGGQGIFAGGAIAPGPSLLARALAEGGAQLPAFEPKAGAAALGTSTEAALRAGVAVGFRGAARELVDEVAAGAGLDAGCPVLLTGGAREYLLLPRPFTHRRLRVEEDLVHVGLLQAVRHPSTSAG